MKYVELERVQIWADANGDIHLSSDDPDAKDFLHTTINNKPTSKRYHPTMYRQFARLLTMHGKVIPGWDAGVDGGGE
ncbi:hypothetical protein [Georgenia sp. H159]|uniref:hypothetical protein n=1 Tax=Georgenia sp. H159 TaxID=3076115 RepID=UPI002D78444F|nr:hypothetical protein [Georgenia sp. H159]